MQTKTLLLATLASVASARFGQEGLVQSVIQALGAFGPPGAAGTLAGQTPSVLLAGASACAKVRYLSFTSFLPPANISSSSNWPTRLLPP